MSPITEDRAPVRPELTNEGGGPLSTGVVVVSRDSAGPLRELLPMLARSPASIVVVDNRSDDDSVEVAMKAGVRVVTMPTNAGYAAACNEGARIVGPSVGWVAFVNPDVSLSAEDLRQLTTDVPDDIWAVAPLTMTLDGRLQPDAARPVPTPWFVAAMYMGLTRSKAPTNDLAFSDGGRYYFTDTLSGSCLLVRRKGLDLVGGWDEAFFFNVEDIDICVRIGMAGGRVALDRFVQVSHHKAHSSSRAQDDGRRLECARAYATFFHIHGSAWETAFVAVTAYFGCVARHVADRMRRKPGSGVASWRYSRLLSVLSSTAREAFLGHPPVRPAQAAFLDP